ncbi:integrin [Marinomonas agarivorans]|nr:integrin [Marinomonas agarivorans]
MRTLLILIGSLWSLSAVAVPPISAAEASLSLETKTFRFSWNDVPDATHYKLLENSDGLSGFQQVGVDIPQGVETIAHIVPLYDKLNASYVLQSCNAFGCVDSTEIDITGTLQEAIGYVKASNTGYQDAFGWSVAINADGTTLAVGAIGEKSSASSIDGDQTIDQAYGYGAVYVFTQTDGVWSQQSYIKPSNMGHRDDFGYSLSLSNDGNRLLVGAPGESSSATGINGDLLDNSALRSGAAYLFERTGTSWTQQTYFKASNTEASDGFGTRVNLSGDGNTIAVTALGENSNSTGINGNQTNNDHTGLVNRAGAVYVFGFDGVNWSQQAYVKASNTLYAALFGQSLSLSDDGNTLAVGAIYEYSNATGINGDQENYSASKSGAAYVFSRTGITWSQQAYIKASNAEREDFFGHAIALSGDGKALAVGANGERGKATGINGDQYNDDIYAYGQEYYSKGYGAVYVFDFDGINWSQQAYIKASNARRGDNFGWSVSLDYSGDTLAVGAAGEDNSARGLNGPQYWGHNPNSGAAYTFIRSRGDWMQQAYIKASNTGWYQHLREVTLSGDGKTLAAGAFAERNNATGINGDQDQGYLESGAVYLY